MPDSGHVIDCARHLAAAYQSFVKMKESGKDRGVALNKELWTLGPETMAQAGSVWSDFLFSLDEIEEPWVPCAGCTDPMDCGSWKSCKDSRERR